MSRFSPYLAFLIAACCMSLLFIALYMEWVDGLIPCALCYAQRFAFVIIAVCACLYMLPFYTSKLIFSSLMASFALIGIWLSGRQLWLQSLPEDKVPACGPDIYFIMERLPFSESLQSMLFGSGSCAEVQWTLLGISIPGWTFIFFLLILIASVWLMLFRGTPPFRLFKK
ncbi:disulfide bond formation protein B [Litorivicinus sp.]|nr:disulfide bond formation protein B [Litorivicinus sp.]